MANLEKLDQLPKKESRKEYITRKYGDMWNLTRFDNPWHFSDKSDSPYTISQRVIKKFLNKSFNDAFSYYCTLVPKQYQYEFFNQFNMNLRHKYSKFIINAEGYIILNLDRYIRTKHEISLKSLDYEEGYMHKITKEILSVLEYRKIKWFYSNEYIRIVIKGYEQIFESKKDPAYKRLKAALIQQKKLNNRAWKIYNRTKAVCFLTSDEKQKKSEIPLDIINRDRHGFDKYSFIGK